MKSYYLKPTKINWVFLESTALAVLFAFQLSCLCESKNLIELISISVVEKHLALLSVEESREIA